MMSDMVMNKNFLLTLGEKVIPCRSIHGFHRECEQEYIQEGGLNGYVHMRPKPASAPSTLEIERYVTGDFEDVLPNGECLDKDLILQVGIGREGEKSPSMKLTFKGCKVTQKSYGELNAEKGGIFVETTTVSYQELKVGDRM